jgi:hypothetical protein
MDAISPTSFISNPLELAHLAQLTLATTHGRLRSALVRQAKILSWLDLGASGFA